MPGETTPLQKTVKVCLCIRGKWEYNWRELGVYQLSGGAIQLSGGDVKPVNAGRKPFFPRL